MKRPLKRIKSELKELWSEAGYYKYCADRFEGNDVDWPTPTYQWHIFLQNLIVFYIIGPIQYTICRKFGHRWHVEANIGPESGREYFTCTRCGWNEDIVYY